MKVIKLILIVILAAIAVPSFAMKYNVQNCSSCNSSEASRYFNRQAGKSPVYYVDINRGTISGYSRYLIQEPGFPGSYGVRRTSVPSDLQASFNKVLEEVRKLKSSYASKSSVAFSTRTSSLNSDSGGVEPVIWMPDDIADSPWDLAGSSATRNEAIHHLQNNVFSDISFKLGPVTVAWNKFMTISQKILQLPDFKFPVHFRKFNPATGKWEFTGKIVIEVKADISGNVSVKFDLNTAQDAEFNDVKINAASFANGGAYRVTDGNYIDIGEALNRMSASWGIPVVRRPVAIGCASGGPCRVVY